MNNIDFGILFIGITIGILTMSITYTFIRFLYNKEIFYISYSLMQVFSLLYLLNLTNISNVSKFVSEFYIILATIFAFSFGISFFQKSFLPNIKSLKDLFLYSFLLVFIIVTSLYHYFLFSYLPYTIIYFLLFVSFVITIKDGIKINSIYVIGWSFVCLFLYIFDFYNIYLIKYNLDIIILAFCFEALLFTITIGYKYYKSEINQEEEKNKLLQQTRLAKTGEMVANITHQYRQPLNNISFILINIKKRFDKNQLEKEYFYNKYEMINNQLQYMSKTIEDFKDFYSIETKKDDFYINEAIIQAITILKPRIERKNILFEFNEENSNFLKVYGIKNYLSQVIVIIVSNSIDALKDTNLPKITIDIINSNDKIIISIKDNGSGIKFKNPNNVFEAYKSTKENGTGLGLYLVKSIIEDSFEANIEVRNLDIGCEFKLLLPKSI